MRITPAFALMLEEALAPLGNVNIRRIFSGAGVFARGVMLGLVIEDRLYLRTDAKTQPKLAAEGGQPFSFKRGDRVMVTKYWSVPDRLYDEPEELGEWAREALDIALEAEPGKATRAGKSKPKAPSSKRGRRR